VTSRISKFTALDITDFDVQIISYHPSQYPKIFFTIPSPVQGIFTGIWLKKVGFETLFLGKLNSKTWALKECVDFDTKRNPFGSPPKGLLFIT
jgi:hypothetical protein